MARPLSHGSFGAYSVVSAPNNYTHVDGCVRSSVYLLASTHSSCDHRLTSILISHFILELRSVFYGTIRERTTTSGIVDTVDADFDTMEFSPPHGSDESESHIASTSTPIETIRTAA